MHKFLTTTSEVAALLPILMQKPDWGYDTETTGLDATRDKIILAQFGRTEEQYVIDARRASLEPLRPFFESREHKKIIHNAKFDYKFTKGTFGIDIENMRDTYLAEKILNMGRMFRGFGLDDLLLKRLNVYMDKELQKSFIGHTGDFSEQQILYAALDVRELIPLCCNQAREMAADGVANTWLLECAAAACFGDMEMHGAKLDIPHWKSLIDESYKKAQGYKAEMDEFAKLFFPVDLFGDVRINYGSPDQMLDLLLRMKVKVKMRNPETKEETEVPVPDTSDKVLKKLKGYPIVDLLKKYRSAMIRVNTFGQSWIDAVNPETGRIHPNFAQIGTETGRIASGDSEVNFLNVPREKAYRRGIVAAEDYLIETDDYSGCELRILAEISGDPQLAEAFMNGVDVHCYVASKLYRVEVTKNNENAKLRTPAKNLNFGRH